MGMGQRVAGTRSGTNTEAAAGWIGTGLRRREDKRLVTGKGRYIADIRLPGMLELAVFRSDHAHARIGRLDVSDARKSPGIQLVLTGADVEQWTEPFRFKHSNPRLRRLEWRALATDVVRYVGEPVAAVVAANRYVAEDALERIRVEYEPLPAVVSTEEAVRPDAPRVFAEWPDNEIFHHEIVFGDIAEAFRQAEVVLKESFSVQRHSGHPMETRGCVAEYDGRCLTVWSTTQWPYVLRTVLAECLRLRENQIRVIAPDVGGAFGVKMHVYPEDVLVSLAALRLGRPVRWIEDRREHFVSTVHARELRAEVELAATRDGRLLGLRARLVADVGTGMIIQPSIGPATNTVLTLPGPYRLPAYEAHVHWVVTNKTPVGAYRGYGVPEAAFITERAMDLLAAEIGLDPVDVRRRNLLQPEELPYVTAAGLALDTGDYPELLNRALAAAEYEDWRRRQRELRAQNRFIGIGVACYLKGTVSDPRSSMGAWGSYESATVRVDLDGSVTVFSGLADQGQGHRTMLSQVVASVLGVDPDVIDVRLGETSTAGYGLGAWGSRGAAMGGATALRAAEALRERMRAIAAYMLHAHPEELEWTGGRFIKHGEPGGLGVSIHEIARFCYNQSPDLPQRLKPPLEASASLDASVLREWTDGRGRLNKWLTYTGGVHVVVAEVDVLTGMVRILRHVSVHDVGKAVNPLIVDGQDIGGIAQGLGGALLEELIYDSDGQLLTTTFMDYLLPTATEMPEDITTVHVEYLSPHVPGGFKGAGEGSVVGAFAAIANAVADALQPFGVRVTRTPLSPSRVRDLLRGAGA